MTTRTAQVSVDLQTGRDENNEDLAKKGRTTALFC